MKTLRRLAKKEDRKIQMHWKTPDRIKDNLTKEMAIEGQKIYSLYCTSCHQIEGNVDGVRYPTLEGSDWVSGDKTRLISEVLDGLAGPITLYGKPFEGVMPKKDFLSDRDIAKVLSYIRLNFKNNAGAIYEKKVTKVRDEIKFEQDEI